MDTVIVCCPRCSLSAEAVLEQDYYKFIIYKCPRCGSNVVMYEDKIQVISNRLIKKLIKAGKLRFCGNISFKMPPHKPPITDDDILNLKILLETESDSATIINNL